MHKDLLYLIGPPGAGKTTLFSKITEGLSSTTSTVGVPHVIWEGKYAHVVELGVREGIFSGTDRLSMSIQPKAVEFMGEAIHPRVMAEGDRLANDKFFQAVGDKGWQLHLFYLNTPRDALEDRRAARTLEVGKSQNRTWLRGRESKVVRLAEAWNATIVPGDAPFEEQYTLMRQNSGLVLAALGHPNVEAIA